MIFASFRSRVPFPCSVPTPIPAFLELQLPTGGCCNNLEELLCTVGIPSMLKPTFIEIERLLGSSFKAYLGELMLQAGQEEKQLAIENNEYHQNVPLITVIVDGGWSKRSHKHSCNANSGAGVIFGAAT